MQGPNGLEGWQHFHTLENGNEVSETLTIARNGKLVRTINGDPFVWRWLFQADGREVVYETGPLHFSMACVRVNVLSGKELERLDCFSYPSNPPSSGCPHWLDALQNSP